MAELWRLVPEPILCFDGDAAGERAAARAAERALPLLQARPIAALCPAAGGRGSRQPDPGPGRRRHAGGAGPGPAAGRGGLAERGRRARQFDTPERRAGLRQEVARAHRPDRRPDRPGRLSGRVRPAPGRACSAGSANAGARPGPPAGRRPGPQADQAARRRREAARRPARIPQRQQGEVVLATLVNHPALVGRQDRDPGPSEPAAGQLDKLRQGRYRPRRASARP